MKMILPLGLLAGLLCYAPVLAQSGVPSEMSYQATVTDENGNLIAPGGSIEHEVIVRIWDSATGGTLIWAEKHDVPVSDGRFSLILGQGVAVSITEGQEPRPPLDTIFDDASLFTEITLTEDGSNESTTLLPRQKLVASSTAMRAKLAEGLVEGGLNLAAIPDGSLTANKIMPESLTSVQIQNGSITNTDLSAAANIAATKLGTGAINNTEFNYLNGLTSGIQSQLNGKANLTGGNSFSGSQEFNANYGTIKSKGGSFSFNQNLTHIELGLGNEWVSRIKSRSDGGGAPYVSLEVASDFTQGSSEEMRLFSGRVDVVNAFSVGGRVGIGVKTPTKAILEVNGKVSRKLSQDSRNDRWAYLRNDSNYVDRSQLSSKDNINDFSIWCSHRVAATQFDAYSDARIKNIQGISNGAADLAVLSGIEITDYIHKDVIESGDREHKMVIAQQLETVYPQAVSRNTNVVPDIYQKSKVKEGWILLTSDLKKGERVRLIEENDEGIYEVLEVREGAFRTTHSPASENVFVYGREVNDFRVVDYNAVAMLNVSATQEIYRQLLAKEKEIEDLKVRFSVMEQREKARDARLVALESLLSKGSAVETAALK